MTHNSRKWLMEAIIQMLKDSGLRKVFGLKEDTTFSSLSEACSAFQLGVSTESDDYSLSIMAFAISLIATRVR
jgi:hypothetical protein